LLGQVASIALFRAAGLASSIQLFGLAIQHLAAVAVLIERGPEPIHEGQAIVEALKKLLSAAAA
jgi:hypothetical protein